MLCYLLLSPNKLTRHTKLVSIFKSFLSTCACFCSSSSYGFRGGCPMKRRTQLFGASSPARWSLHPPCPPGWARSLGSGGPVRRRFPCHCPPHLAREHWSQHVYIMVTRLSGVHHSRFSFMWSGIPPSAHTACWLKKTTTKTCKYSYLSSFMKWETQSDRLTATEVTDDLLNRRSASLNFRFRRSVLLFEFL